MYCIAKLLKLLTNMSTLTCEEGSQDKAVVTSEKADLLKYWRKFNFNYSHLMIKFLGKYVINLDNIKYFHTLTTPKYTVLDC